MTLRELVAQGEAALKGGPHPVRARQDAETLLLHALSQDRAWIRLHEDDEAGDNAEFLSMLARRAVGEPIQYITGCSEFFGLPFSVGPGVLIPRPETEHLVEEVIRLSQALPSPRIADIGTGSGIIAVALAHALPTAQIIAVDLSPQALTVARENAAQNQVAERIEFTEGDLVAPLAGQQFDIIASNPPYIPSGDHESLSVEVRDHEPHSALFAGNDGLEIYQRLIPAAREHLRPSGWLVLEIGYGQRESVEELLHTNHYTDIRFLEDYQKIPRVAIAQNRP